MSILEPGQTPEDVANLIPGHLRSVVTQGGAPGESVTFLGPFWFAAALAQTYYIESDPVGTREPALEVARLAASASVQGRVVRLYVEGQGWRYVFRSEEEEKLESLQRRVGAIRAESAVDVHLVRLVDGRAELMVEKDEPAVSLVPLDRTLEAQEILRRIVRAHAGPVPTDRLDVADALVFRFDRTLDDRRVQHLYVRRGEDLFLQVEVLSGKGTGARLGVVGGKAWMDGADGEGLDVLRIREQIERFSPERVLSLPMEFAAGLPGGREFEHMAVGGTGAGEGDRTVELVWAGDRQSSSMKLVVNVASWRISEVRWGAEPDAVIWHFGAYEELGDGGLFPKRVEVSRGANKIDLVDVSELDLEPAILPEWFEAH